MVLFVFIGRYIVNEKDFIYAKIAMFYLECTIWDGGQ